MSNLKELSNEDIEREMYNCICLYYPDKSDVFYERMNELLSRLSAGQKAIATMKKISEYDIVCEDADVLMVADIIKDWQLDN